MNYFNEVLSFLERKDIIFLKREKDVIRVSELKLEDVGVCYCEYEDAYNLDLFETLLENGIEPFFQDLFEWMNDSNSFTSLLEENEEPSATEQQKIVEIVSEMEFECLKRVIDQPTFDLLGEIRRLFYWEEQVLFAY